MCAFGPFGVDTNQMLHFNMISCFYYVLMNLIYWLFFFYFYFFDLNLCPLMLCWLMLIIFLVLVPSVILLGTSLRARYQGYSIGMKCFSTCKCIFTKWLVLLGSLFIFFCTWHFFFLGLHYFRILCMPILDYWAFSYQFHWFELSSSML